MAWSRLDANKVIWRPMEIHGVNGYFCDERIDRASVPDRFNFYEVADACSNGDPARYKDHILVDFLGTFITEGELPIHDSTDNSGYVNNEDEWGYLDDSDLSLKEILETLDSKADE